MYRYNHWKGCMCESCAAAFQKHNPGFKGTTWGGGVVQCACQQCQNRYYEMVQAANKSDRALTTPGVKGMASINICERNGCDSFIKGKAVGGITLVLNNDPNLSGDVDTVQRMELCPACVEDIYNVLTIEPLSPRERSYSDPFNPNGPKGDTLDGATAEQLAALLFEKLMAAAPREIESRDGYKPKHVAPVSDQTMAGRTYTATAIEYTD